jgi:hypothetical protein
MGILTEAEKAKMIRGIETCGYWNEFVRKSRKCCDVSKNQGKRYNKSDLNIVTNVLSFLSVKERNTIFNRVDKLGIEYVQVEIELIDYLYDLKWLN